MNLLKRENWLVWAILLLLTQGFSNIVLGVLLGCIDKEAWYCKWQNWLLGAVCLLFPVFVMFIVFMIQMTVKVCQKLAAPGEAVYGCPYVWILCVIVPLLGWAMLLVMFFYITIWPVVMLARGNGEAQLLS